MKFLNTLIILFCLFINIFISNSIFANDSNLDENEAEAQLILKKIIEDEEKLKLEADYFIANYALNWIDSTLSSLDFKKFRDIPENEKEPFLLKHGLFLFDSRKLFYKEKITEKLLNIEAFKIDDLVSVMSLNLNQTRETFNPNENELLIPYLTTINVIIDEQTLRNELLLELRKEILIPRSPAGELKLETELSKLALVQSGVIASEASVLANLIPSVYLLYTLFKPEVIGMDSDVVPSYRPYEILESFSLPAPEDDEGWELYHLANSGTESDKLRYKNYILKKYGEDYNHQGIKKFPLKIVKAINSLPSFMKPVLIKESKKFEKIALIGRSMKEVVNVAKEHFLKNGIEVEVFKESDLAKADWEKKLIEFRDKHGDTSRFTDFEIKNTLTFKENTEWVMKLKKDGFMVLDLGDPFLMDHLKGKSPAYEMEKSLLKNGDKIWK